MNTLNINAVRLGKELVSNINTIELVKQQVEQLEILRDFLKQTISNDNINKKQSIRVVEAQMDVLLNISQPEGIPVCESYVPNKSAKADVPTGLNTTRRVK